MYTWRQWLFHDICALLFIGFAVRPSAGSMSYQSRLPNGSEVYDPNSPENRWRGVGHTNKNGGGARNPFGMDFAQHGHEWSPDLCKIDSDSDGFTNGQELGDPCCVWKPGDSPAFTPAPGHPGRENNGDNGSWELIRSCALLQPSCNDDGSGSFFECGEGASCEDLNEGEFICKCNREGFVGESVTNVPAECIRLSCEEDGSGSPPDCGEGASCHEMNTGFSCQCDLVGYVGASVANEAAACTLMTCADDGSGNDLLCGVGATCSSLGTGYLCECMEGYFGSPTMNAAAECIEPFASEVASDVALLKDLSVCYDYPMTGQAGVPDRDADGNLPTRTLKELSAGGTRLVVISNYFNGCFGGITEASGYQGVEQQLRDDPTFPSDRVMFITVLAFSNVESRSPDQTTSGCEQWLRSRVSSYVQPYKHQTIILGDQSSAKYISYSLFNNNHPMYAIIDGNGIAHQFRSRYADGSICDNSEVSSRNLDCSVGGTWGYDQVRAAIPGLMDTLRDEEEVVVNAGGTGEADVAETVYYVPAPMTCAQGFGRGGAVDNGGTYVQMAATMTHVLVGAGSGATLGDGTPPLSSPTDLAWNPDQPSQLWVSNRGTDDFTIVDFEESAGEDSILVASAVRGLGDRAKYHYMASVSSFSFGRKDQQSVATCQESTNTYEGLMDLPADANGVPGNQFMGPTLFNTKTDHLITSEGEPCDPLDSSGRTCFLLHEDMLHETPLCMGIVHDPETATYHGNVYWTFDGFNGMLVRYDFERPHGGCLDYLCADHSEAQVRRYEDVPLSRVPGVPSHMAIDTAHRDLYIADSGTGRLLRVDTGSGRRSRTAIFEYPIYSAPNSIRFDYSMWDCTQQETMLNSDMLAAAGLADDAADFVPSGVVIAEAVVYVANHATGHIIAVDKYHGHIVSMVDTQRGAGAVGGLELIRDANGQEVSLLFVDIEAGELVQIQPEEACSRDDTDTSSTSSTTSTSSASPGAGEFAEVRERRPYPAMVCGPIDLTSLEVAMAGLTADDTEIINHDPGYMNTWIPYDYGINEAQPCVDASTGASNLNLDALLMTGHTCHRCLPEPCLNGGLCTGFRNVSNPNVHLPNPNAPVGVSYGFTCSCPSGYEGDMCQKKISCLDDGSGSAPECGEGASCHSMASGFECRCDAVGYYGMHVSNAAADCTVISCSDDGSGADVQCGYGATCHTTEAGFSCKCDMEGVIGPAVINSPAECTLLSCTAGHLGSQPWCGEGASCRSTTSGFVCHCDQVGYFGADVSNAAADCTRLSCDNNGLGALAQCGDGASCINTATGFLCSCNLGGFFGTPIANGPADCSQVLCTADSTGTPPYCGEGASCHKTAAGFECHCDVSGYTGLSMSNAAAVCHTGSDSQDGGIEDDAHTEDGPSCMQCGSVRGRASQRKLLFARTVTQLPCC